MLGTQTWKGPYASEAASAYQRARLAGMSELRARILGHVASFRETWAFASSLADWVHASRRTVFRAFAQGKEFGLINSRPLKTDEIPPGVERPITCGGSMRWTIGWGKAIGEAAAAVAAARVRWMLRPLTKRHVAKPPRRPVGDDRTNEPGATHGPREERAQYRKPMTAEEIDAALERENGPPT